jgi:hypothetical protein
MRISLAIRLCRNVARLLSLHWLPHRQCLSRQNIIILVLRYWGIWGCSHEVRMHRLLLHVFYIACGLLIHQWIVLQLRILLYSSGRSTSQSERVQLCSVRVEAQSESRIVYFRYKLRPFNAYMWHDVRSWESLTREIVIGLSSLFGHVELVEVQALVVEDQGTLVLSEMFVKKIYRPDH